MLRFVVRRLLLLVPILIGLSILVFLWIRALPGGPAQALLGERATPETVAAIEREYGLDEPIHVQYWKFLKRSIRLDFGDSVTTRRPVTEELKERFPATIELAVPIFVLAILLKYVFAIELGLLPTVGRLSVLIDLEHPTNFYVLDALIAGNWEALSDSLKHLVLPAIALGTIPLAIIARITRAAVLDVQNEDYVRTARAKGVAPRLVDTRHILRNAMLPISTIIGLQVGLLLSGAVLTETVFAWPGLGSWLVSAIENRDFPVLQGGILFVALVFVLVNLVVDVSYAVLNPRLRLS